MGWKSIELQVALPRVQDAGKLQEQMSKNNQRFQESLAQKKVKQAELKRTQVNESEEVIKTEVKNEGKDTKDSFQSHDQAQEDKQDEVFDHPYLGSKIDFSG